MNLPVSTDLQRRRIVAGLPLLATGLFLQPAFASAQVQQASRDLMGTRVTLTVHGRSADAAQEAMTAAWAEMTRLADAMSRYRTGNTVHALQLAAGVQPVVVPPEMLRTLQAARDLSERSAGAFDITVGAYAGWAFDPAQPRIPDAAELAREQALVNYRDLQLDPAQGRAFLRRRGMRIDLGGVAKLPILHAGLLALQRQGIEGAMVNGGGDVLTTGHLEGRPWRVGLRDPRAPERVLGTLSLNDGIVASSGDYERCFVQAGRRYHHILDPRTGLPTQGPRGVTLVSRRVDDINGLGATIMAAGSDAGRRLLAPMQGVDALIVGRDAGLWTSPGMAARLRA
ncbi:FAD:protein FMN transferase [Rhizobacter sp. LjRoot28]|uniref:FAD:protein FMN transferase n=1 Tax=Rhizobacter sp. LjRoot28 TaxID=3342309 RepID=UPI003ECD14FE